MNQRELWVQTLDGEYHSLDLDIDAVFSLNYFQSTLENPTVIKDTYSANITIPKSQNNNHILGHIWRVDSIIFKYNPSLKANFKLFVNGNIFEEGYIQLLEIDETSYQIRLFGNLGNFFGDLDEVMLSNLPVDEANYTHQVNANTVYDAMINNNGYYGYTPSYQGEYENFDPSLIFEPKSSSNAIQGGELVESYWEYSGQKYSNVDLTENKRQTGDFFAEYRSYYQKPTLRVQPIIESIVEKAEELGYTVELDEDFFNDNNPYYAKAWIQCKNYETQDTPGSFSFKVSKFGGVQIEKRWNEMSGIDLSPESGINKDATSINGGDVNPDDFKGPGINTGVIISDPISMDEGDTITANLNLRTLAVYSDLNYDSKYRKKDPSITVNLKFYEQSGTGYVEVGSSIPATSASADVAVNGRQFNDTNVQRKRPTNEGFDRGNFGYDAKVDGGGSAAEKVRDYETVWKYKNSYTAASSTTIFVGVQVLGNAAWTISNGTVRNGYGISFEVLDGSIISVNPETSGSNIDQDGIKRFRSGTESTFADMIGSAYTAKQFLLSYCKVFGLFFYVDRIEGTVKVSLRDNYYDESNILDWTNRVDRSRDYIITPTVREFRKGVFQWNPLDTKYEELYRNNTSVTVNGVVEETGREYGSANIITGYELSDAEFSYLDGNIFDNCIIASDYSAYYKGRGTPALKDNKELPHLQDASESKVEQDGFILLFRSDEKLSYNKPFIITDDNDVMTDNGTICWSNSGITIGGSSSPVLPYFRTHQFTNEDGNQEYYSWNFQMPNQSFSASENVNKSNIALFPRYWRGYIYDRLDENSKLLKCYVALNPSDLQYNLLSKFIYIDNTLWVIDSIKDFNPLSAAPTQVNLIRVQDRNNYLDHSYLSDNFMIEYNGSVIFNNVSGDVPEPIYIDESTTNITLAVTSNVNWHTSGGLNITPDSGQASDTPIDIDVEIPLNQSSGIVTFNYNGQTVNVKIFRQTLVTVTATTVNGTSASINGNPSPQEIAVGNTARFSATGDTTFLRWEINGVEYTQQTVTITITEDTTATAYFLSSGQVMLFSSDPYTTITGETKQGNYWILNVGQSYNFVNTQSNLSGFLFGSDTEFTSPGSRTILETDTILNVYYDQILLNLTVINNSDTYEFTGDNIFLGEGNNFEFTVGPGETIQATASGDIDNNITFTKYPYHYPTFSQSTFTGSGVYDVTITAYNAGWIGDVTEDITESGYVSINRTAYGPVQFNLISDLSISPNQGSSDTNVAIELTGNGGTVTQRFAPDNLHSDTIEYQLILNQDNAAGSLGYTSARLVAYQSTVTQTATSATVIFYHNNAPLTLSSGLSKGGDTTDADGAVYSTMTATFSANTGSERQLTFTIQAGGQAYIWTITQAGTGGSNANQWWGQTANAAGVVQGTLNGTGDIVPLFPQTYTIGTQEYFFNNVYANGLQPNQGSVYDLGTSIYRWRRVYTNDIYGNPGVASSPAVLHSVGLQSSSGVIVSFWNINGRLYVGNQADQGAADRLGNNGYNMYADQIGCVAVTQTSDINNKDIIEVINGSSIDLSSVNAYNYKFKEGFTEDNSKEYTGLIAQELKPVIPNAVRGEEGNYSVDYSAVTAVLLAKIKELEERINQLENK